MAIVHVQTKQQSPTAATRLSGVTLSSETFAATPTVGNLVVLYVGFFSSGAGASTLTSVTDNQLTPNIWTIEQNVFDAAHSNGVAIAWSIITTASGTFTVKANFSTNSDTCIGISEFSGVASSSPVDGSNSGIGTGFAPAGGSVTPSTSSDLFVSAVSDDSLLLRNLTIPTGWDTKRAENAAAGGECLSSASKIATDASAQSSTWTSDVSNNWQAAIVAFKAAAGGGAISDAPLGSFDPEKIVLAWFDPDLLQQRGPWLNASGNSNLLLSPEQIGDVNWTVSGATISATQNFALAPDGTTHATRGVVTDASGHALYETATVSPSTTYTFSFLAKNNGGTRAAYSVYDNTHAADIVAATSYFAQLNGVSYVKVRISFTTPAGTTSINVYPLRDSAGTVDLLLWGAKLELGSLATGYARAVWSIGWFDWDLLGPVTVYETKGAFDVEQIVKAWFDYELISKRNWFDWELPIPAVVAGTTYSQGVDGTLTSAASLVKQTGKILAGTLTDVGALVKQTARALAGTLTDSGALVKQAQKILAGNLTDSGTLVTLRTAHPLLAGTLTSSGAIVKQTQKVLAGSMASTGALVKQTGKVLAGVLTSAGAIVKQTGKVLGGTLTSSGTLLAVKAALKSLSGTLTSAGALTKQTAKTFAGTLTSSGALVRQTQKVLAGALALSGAIVNRTQKVLAATLTSSGALAGSKVVLKALVGTFTSAGALTKQAGKMVAGSLASSGALSRRIATSIAGTLAPIGTIAKRTARSFSGALSFLGSVAGIGKAANVDNILDPVVLRQAAREAIVVQPAARATIVLAQATRAAVAVTQATRSAIPLTQPARDPIILKTRS